MKCLLTLLLFAIVSATRTVVEQDPCAGCTTDSAAAYQKCALEFGNACAETNEAGIVGNGPGTKKDVGCCMKKQKHDTCMKCKSMDCAYKTCNVNANYYSEYGDIEDAKTKTKEAYKKYDDKAMKAAGWGL